MGYMGADGWVRLTAEEAEAQRLANLAEMERRAQPREVYYGPQTYAQAWMEWRHARNAQLREKLAEAWWVVFGVVAVSAVMLCALALPLSIAWAAITGK
jgi:hypothetical protein